MVERIEAVSVALYAVHSDLQSIAILGKDADKFLGVMTRIGNIQGLLDNLARDIKAKEKEAQNVGNPE